MGHTPFARLLKAEMRRQGLSVRRLGRLVDPADPERGRRRVQRHLSGTQPTAASRKAYADVLNAPQLADGEEEDETVVLHRALRLLQKKVRAS